MTTTVTNSCNGWVGCPQTCYPGSVTSTTKITEIIPNANIYNLPSTQNTLTIGDNISGVTMGVAMLPCQNSEGDCTGDLNEPECANTCTGIAATACVSCSCKTQVNDKFNVNGTIDAKYYDITSGDTTIYEFPATLNWYGGSYNLEVNDVYTTPILPTTAPTPNWDTINVSFYIRDNFMYGIARIDLNNFTTDSSGRRLYAGSSDQNVRYGSQVAIMCFNETIGRWMYLALSSVSGYLGNDATNDADVFIYSNWLNAWGVWRTMPMSIGSNLAQTHPFYGDGIWNLWDPNGAGVTNPIFQGGAFYLQNWMLATTEDTATDWTEVYQNIPNNLPDTASRVGYLARYNTALPASTPAIYTDFKDDYVLASPSSACLAIQKIAPGYFGTIAAPVGSNEDYFGAPLFSVSATLSELISNPEGLTDQTTCVVGENDQTSPTPPDCNCTDTKQFFVWYVVAYQGCLVESETICPPESPQPQPIPSTVPTWVPWVVAILAAIVLILLGVIVWYAVRYKNLETWEADKAIGNIGYTPNVTGINQAGVSII